MYLFVEIVPFIMFIHKLATNQDIPNIKALMLNSIEKLLGTYLNEDEMEASYESMGLDDQLIKDETYFLVYSDNILVGCGGWSNRKTLFGGNHTPNRENNFLNPKIDAAKIRAMYTHPDWSRKGIGTLLLKLSEEEALKANFRRCELMATQAGIPLYEKNGYKHLEEVLYKSKTGKTVRMSKMIKEL